MSVRAKLKAASAVAKQNEVYCLLHWEDEDKVSIHKTSDLNLELEESGVAYVKIGRKYYAGKIAGYGTKEAMVALEQDYIDGKIEFNDENIDPIDPGNRKDLKSHNNDDAVAQANKKEVDSTKKRKRKLIDSGVQKSSIVVETKVDETKDVKKRKKTKPTKDRKKPKKGKEKKRRGSIIDIGSGKESIQDDSESDDTVILEEDSERWSTLAQLQSSPEPERPVVHTQLDLVEGHQWKAAGSQGRNGQRSYYEQSVSMDNRRRDTNEVGSTDDWKPDAHQPESINDWRQFCERPMSSDHLRPDTNQLVSTRPNTWRPDAYQPESTNDWRPTCEQPLDCLRPDTNRCISTDGWRPNTYQPVSERPGSMDGSISPRPMLQDAHDRWMWMEIKGIAKDVSSVNTRVQTLERKLLDVFSESKGFYMESTGANQASSPIAIMRSPFGTSAIGASPSTTVMTSPTGTSNIGASPSTAVRTSPTGTISSATIGTSPSTGTPAVSFLKGLERLKKSNPLPAINKVSLLSPEEVVNKNPKLLKSDKIPTLSVRLAKESFFGKNVMSRCTVRGTGSYHALPESELKALKEYVMQLCIPRFAPTKVDFEIIWKGCIESIGQACKSLRNVQ